MSYLTKTYPFLLIPVIIFSSCSMPEHPVSQAEAMKLAHRIEYSAAHHDYAVLNNVFDERELSRRISSEGSLFMSNAMVKGALEGFRQGQYGKAVIDAMGSDGTYQLVKQYEKEKKQHILFRLNGEGGVNYHDYELVKRDEAIKAADVYIYMSGENISKTLADALQLTSQNVPKADVEKIDKVKTIKTLMSQGEYQKGLNLYDDLPEPLKKGKFFQLIHLRLCAKLGNDKYIEALNEYRTLFPKDPNMYLMMVDAYVLEKDYPNALNAVNKLDSIIDKDPYQDYQRGLLYLLMKDTAHAQQSFEHLHASMPKLKKGTVELMETYYYTHDEDKAAQVVREARDSNYLSEQNLEALYSYHPDLKRRVEKDTKGN